MTLFSKFREKSGLRGRRIIVDLLPIVPGGANGGVKPFALELVRGLSRLERRCTFFLLASERNHRELRSEESKNVSLVRVDERTAPSFLHRIGLQKKKDPIAKLRADLIFCPFTGISYPERGLPTVTVVCDMLYRSYPQFFEERDLNERISNFERVRRHSTFVVCISEHVRKSVVESGGIAPDRVSTILIRLSTRLGPAPIDGASKIPGRCGVRPGRYLLYPGNFWPHKNHRMLLTALGMYHARNPGSDLAVVCTGEPDSRLHDLIVARDRFSLKERLNFAGFVSDAELAQLYRSCRAVVFPSLYEGFGLPVLEAMSFGKPVVLSNAGSLPEIGANAAIYFDPRNPEELVKALESLETESAELDRVVADGFERARFFGKTEVMCREYAEVFERALQNN